MYYELPTAVRVEGFSQSTSPRCLATLIGAAERAGLPIAMLNYAIGKVEDRKGILTVYWYSQYAATRMAEHIAAAWEEQGEICVEHAFLAK